MAAAAGGAALLLALWLPWFTRRFASVNAEQSLSGWHTLGRLGFALAALALVSVVWAMPRRPAVSAVWLVLAGGAALMVIMGVTVDRVGNQDPGASTTTPSLGLAVAYGGALAVILVGLVVLVQETRRRTQEG